jgi:hypothetical protein
MLGGFTALVVAGVAWATPGSDVTTTILTRPVMLDEIGLKSSADTHEGAEAELDSREALSLSVATTITASPSLNNTAGALQLAPPAAPSHCKVGHFTIKGIFGGTFWYLSWKDNSSNEDGFTVEWWQKQSGIWVLVHLETTAASSTTAGVPAKPGPDQKFRVRAFNASGDSAWSNWAH